MDAFGRAVDYLRISITDRCNERCLYCMPEKYRGWADKPDSLSTEELVRVVRVGTQLGFRRFRLTGGEPLVRRDVVELVGAMRAIRGVESIGLSTNGIHLARYAGPLRAAGLCTVNVSLDTLDQSLYRRITGGELQDVLAGIHAALAVGFERIKLNCVLMRGVNEDGLWTLARFASAHGLPLRFIELMPLTSKGVLDASDFLSVTDAMRLLREHDELDPVDEADLGWGPAKYHRLRRTGGLVGFIGAITNPHFCDTCNKMRLTADGKIRPCLGDPGELDLRAALRAAQTDEALREVFEAALRNKPREHAFNRDYHPCRPMTALGG